MLAVRVPVRSTFGNVTEYVESAARRCVVAKRSPAIAKRMPGITDLRNLARASNAGCPEAAHLINIVASIDSRRSQRHAARDERFSAMVPFAGVAPKVAPFPIWMALGIA